jgi:hypothetical protein
MFILGKTKISGCQFKNAVSHSVSAETLSVESTARTGSGEVFLLNVNKFLTICQHIWTLKTKYQSLRNQM